MILPKKEKSHPLAYFFFLISKIYFLAQSRNLSLQIKLLISILAKIPLFLDEFYIF